ncbi:tripartite tricarboxylate transporter permease [Consotaella salsifontis]|uniref:Putative tricarboxylic transport membrane protein n=1 Tax=Consotaella salsifontis TaxID=1365950 RepID=A0A1T4LJA3_9HYPH|nr:tripartite tricarboxylate transporter permease [Consotaella salsifontis]SJZ54514.1 putative tricarboxylic transport membrane protein [Consotaella salsifontis]
MDFALSILAGFGVLLKPTVFAYMVGGFLIGTFFGAVPGLTATLAIALLLPITFSLDVETSLVMCAAIFMSGMYAGSITATTINIPGAPSSMMTSLEGYPLMKKGEGASALGHAALGSMVGGTLGAVFLILFTPLAAKLALLIQTPGKFSLVLFALIVIAISHRGLIAKSVVTTAVGVMVATVGIDVMQPVARFVFDSPALVEGIGLMPVVIGTFAVSELLIQAQDVRSARTVDQNNVAKLPIRRRDFVPTREQLREIGAWTYIKSTIIGFMIGVLPGAGGSMAAFVSYAEAMRKSKRPELFGKGSREGIAAAEAANNSMCGGAFVPMLMFGIPGDPTTAIVLGVLVINGLQPGPRLLARQLDLIAPMFASLLISALILIPLTLWLLGPYFVKIVSIRKALLYSSIAVIALVGTYVATFSPFQMVLSLVFGVLAFFLRVNNYPTVTLLLGFILGPDLESYLRRTLSLNHGDPTVFLTNLDSLFFLLLTLVFFYLMVIKKPKVTEATET